MMRFSTFLGNKDRENKEHLHILKQIFEKAGFEVSNNLNGSKEPYVYVKKPDDLEELTFGGIRLYTRGKDIICYRVQNKEKTEPYGNTYELDVKGMFKDLVKESSKDKIGYKIIFYIINDVKDFFINSDKAERQAEPDDPMGSVVVGSTGTDYANMISKDLNWRR